MRPSAFFALLVLFSVSHQLQASANADPPQMIDANADQEVTEQEVAADEAEEVSSAAAAVRRGGIYDVVCISSATLNVRDAALKKVLFNAKRYEKVKTFQGWGNNSQMKSVGGKKHTFVKVQFTEREGRNQANVGWIAKGFIKAAANCKGAVREERQVVEQQARANPAPRVSSAGGGEEFPLNAPPQTAIDAKGMWNFGWRRSQGRRIHAACDLYGRKGDAIVSVLPGVVLNNLYYFYQNTYALEVRHSDGRVVRYGEILGKTAAGVSAGRRVNTGQVLGYMGKTSHPNPMLHFEMYKGTGKGSLSTRTNKYQRRSDLMDPTSSLLKWQSAKFRDRR